MTNMLREGMRAAISCQILEGDLPVSFRWERNDKQILGTGNEVIRRLDEYSTSLVIEHIASDHSGNYTCQASNIAGSERFTVPLTVNVPPKWIVEPKDSNVQAGQDVTLNCQADGFPKPTITWRKAIGTTPGEYKDFLFEPNISLHANGSIYFKKITKTSQSHFLCEAKNGIGAGVSKVIFLKINVPAHFASKSKQVYIAKGKQVHLQCNIVGDTPIDIKWKIQQTQQYIDESIDSRYSIREQVLDDGMVSELGISHTYRQDSGIYVCLANNAFGQDELLIQLVVQEVPESPKNLRINQQQSKSIQISWNTPFTGNSPIEEYIVQYKVLSENWQNAEKVVVLGTESQVTINKLRPAKAYHVRVTADNKFGSSEFSEMIQVTTLEEVPAGPPMNVKTETKSSTEIFVSWDAPERELWNGNLLGYYVGYQIVTNPKSKEILPTQGYNFKTIEVQSHFGGDVILTGLHKYTAYKIVVQAYTSQGSGPTSKELIVNTLEDVPSSPPENPKCNVLSSTSIYVTWSPPNNDGQNGKIKGYKVSYVAAEDLYEKSPIVSTTTNQYYTIDNNVRKFTNYSINVLAFTVIGDGVKTRQFHCVTHEDGKFFYLKLQQELQIILLITVPSAPQSIKAIPSSSTKIIVSWLPPRFRNGDIVSIFQ